MGGLGERQSRGSADVFFWYGLPPYGPMPSVQEPKPGLVILGKSPEYGSRRIAAILRANVPQVTTGLAKWEKSALERRPLGHAYINHITSAPGSKPSAAVAMVAALVVMSWTESCLVTHTVSYIGSTTSHDSR